MYCVILFSRSDRLGSNIMNYICQIIVATENKFIIKYNKSELKYNESIFVSSLLYYIDCYNNSIINSIDKDNLKYIYISHPDFYMMMTQAVKVSHTDYITYFKTKIFPLIQNEYYSISKQYKIPFNKSKTIGIHLRLDDQRLCPDYDGSVCSSYYRKKLNNNEDCYYNDLYESGYNIQGPLSQEKLVTQIELVKEKYPDYDIIIITNPGEKIELPYTCYQSSDENYDLFLLSCCEILIISRSNFSFCSLLFGDYKEAWVPLWGGFICYGLDTTYDQSKLNYFY